MRRSLATLALAASVATPLVSATPAEAMYCGVLHPVCQTVCFVVHTATGAFCID